MRINFRSLYCFFEDQFVGLITSRASVGILNLPLGTAIDLLRVEDQNVLGKEAFLGRRREWAGEAERKTNRIQARHDSQ